MTERMVWKFGITEQFRIAKCVSVPAGWFHDIGPAPSNAVAIAGSDNLVLCPDMMIVTDGAFEMKVEGLGSIVLHPGDIGSSERYRGNIRIEATEDGSSYVCLSPRSGGFWERQAGFIAAGREITVETPACAEAFLFVATGGLSDEAGKYGVGALVPLLPGVRTFTGSQDTHFMQVWR